MELPKKSKRTRRKKINQEAQVETDKVIRIRESEPNDNALIAAIENEITQPQNLATSKEDENPTATLTNEPSSAANDTSPPPATDSPGITGVSVSGGEDFPQKSSSSFGTSKSGKRRHFTIDCKLELVKKAKLSSNREVARLNSIDESVIRAWRKDEEKLRKTLENQKLIHISLASSSVKTTGMNPKKFRVTGGGRKPANEQLEEILNQWIIQRRSDGKHVTRKNIQSRAKQIFDDMGTGNVFTASDGWCTNFMKRYGFSTRRKTHQSQKLPNELVPKIVEFFYFLRNYLVKHIGIAKSQLVAMDETCVFLENVANRTISVTGKFSS